MPMAASLASGSPWHLRHGEQPDALGVQPEHPQGSDFVRGMVLDRETSRWDSLSRKSGYLSAAPDARDWMP
jgi:hypothetical protein